MDEVPLKIAGEITFSKVPGSSLRKWREIFGITQTELAKHLGITPSTMSDYEGNRRKSPGVKVIRRFVKALCDIDESRGGWIVKKLQGEVKKDIYEVIDFSAPQNAYEFCRTIDAKIMVNEGLLKNEQVHGCTFVDSLRAILELPADEFIKIYGSTTERALIFTNVSMGRSPMVAIRVTKLKPSVVVLHNIRDIDKLALKIAEVERIPLVTTMLSVDEIKRKLV